MDKMSNGSGSSSSSSGSGSGLAELVQRVQSQAEVQPSVVVSGGRITSGTTRTISQAQRRIFERTQAQKAKLKELGLTGAIPTGLKQAEFERRVEMELASRAVVTPTVTKEKLIERRIPDIKEVLIKGDPIFKQTLRRKQREQMIQLDPSIAAEQRVKQQLAPIQQTISVISEPKISFETQEKLLSVKKPSGVIEIAKPTGGELLLSPESVIRREIREEPKITRKVERALLGLREVGLEKEQPLLIAAGTAIAVPTAIISTTIKSPAKAVEGFVFAPAQLLVNPQKFLQSKTTTGRIAEIAGTLIGSQAFFAPIKGAIGKAIKARKEAVFKRITAIPQEQKSPFILVGKKGEIIRGKQTIISKKIIPEKRALIKVKKSQQQTQLKFEKSFKDVLVPKKMTAIERAEFIIKKAPKPKVKKGLFGDVVKEGVQQEIIEFSIKKAKVISPAKVKAITQSQLLKVTKGQPLGRPKFLGLTKKEFQIKLLDKKLKPTPRPSFAKVTESGKVLSLVKPETQLKFKFPVKKLTKAERIGLARKTIPKGEPRLMALEKFLKSKRGQVLVRPETILKPFKEGAKLLRPTSQLGKRSVGKISLIPTIVVFPPPSNSLQTPEQLSAVRIIKSQKVSKVQLKRKIPSKIKESIVSQKKITERKPKEITKVALGSISITTPLLSQQSSLGQETIPKTIQESISIEKPIVRQIPTPVIPKPLPTLSPPFLEKGKSKKQPTTKKEKKVPAYDVFVKKALLKKGKIRESRGYTKANRKKLTKEEAINLGARLTDTYFNRSFKVRKTKKTVKPKAVRLNRGLLGKFRTAKRNSNIFVEKTIHAIDSFQEKQGIPFKAARLRRAGLINNKRSKFL